jgi:hypothetical protein
MFAGVVGADREKYSVETDHQWRRFTGKSPCKRASGDLKKDSDEDAER